MQMKFSTNSSSFAEEEILNYQVRPTPRSHTVWLEWINRVEGPNASQPELHALLENYAKSKADGKFTLKKGADFLDQISKLKLLNELKLLPRLSLSFDREEDLRVLWAPPLDKGGPTPGPRFLLSFLLFLTIQETVGHPQKIKVCEYCKGFFLDSSRAYSAKYGNTCSARAKRDARLKRKRSGG